MKKSYLVSLISTFSLWTIFTLSVVFIPLPEKQEKEKFTEVKLNLSPIEKVEEPKEKENSEKVPVEQPEHQQEKPKTVQTEAPTSQPVVEEPKTSTPVEAPKATSKPEEPVSKPTAKSTETVTTPKETPKSTTETQSFTPVKQELVPFLDDDSINENNAKNVPKNPDDFDDFFAAMENQEALVSTQEQKEEVKIENNSGFSGSAGTGTSSNSSEVTASSTNSTQNQDSPTDSTLENLKNLKPKTYTTETAFGETEITAQTVTQEGGTGFQLEDGKIRTLIFPNKVKISLPENAKIERDVTFKITFTVKKDGTVPYSEIFMTNEALLDVETVKAIKNQIAQWKFESSNTNGQGSLDYSIIIK